EEREAVFKILVLEKKMIHSYASCRLCKQPFKFTRTNFTTQMTRSKESRIRRHWRLVHNKSECKWKHTRRGHLCNCICDECFHAWAEHFADPIGSLSQ